MSITVLIILVSISSLYFLSRYLLWMKLKNKVDKIPGPKRIPFFGTIMNKRWRRRENVLELESKLMDEYGTIYRTWTGNHPVIHILKAEHAEVLLKDTQNLSKGYLTEFIKPWLGNSLLTTSGDLWHSRRKLLTPSFHFKTLEDYTTVFIKKAQLLTEMLGKKCDDYIEILSVMKLCGLDIICETAMGVKLNTMENSNNTFLNHTELATQLFTQRLLIPWLHYDLIFKKSKLGKKFHETIQYLHNFTDDVIQQKKKSFKPEIDSKKYKRLAFLDLLLETSENGRVLTDEDIKNEVNTFMLAGYDTTTVATSWCLFLLGNHPEIQQKLHEELDTIFQDRPVTISDLKQLKYLEMCIKEALRLYPSVPNIYRYITHPITIAGYEIPIDCNVRLHIHRIHRDPDHFPNPDGFNPDNFLPENCSKRHPFAFIPFSAGIRNCIGQKFAYLEEKVLVSTILRKFKVRSLLKPEEINIVHEFFIKPLNGFKIKLEPRQSK